MRHLLNTYIQADPAADLGNLSALSLTELIIETGIHDAIARKLNEKGKLSRNAIAEGIINNVRKTIIRDQLTDPRFYAEMSKLLEDLIRQSRADTAAYEEFLKKAEELVKRMAQEARGGHPAMLHGNPRPSCSSTISPTSRRRPFSAPPDDEQGELALESTWPCARTPRQVGRATRLARSRYSTRFSHHVSGPAGDAGDFRDHQEPARVLMNETIQLGEISIQVTRKDIKHVHLSVHPPGGRVTLAAPTATRWKLPAPTRSPSWAGFASSRRNARAGARDTSQVRRAGEPLPLGPTPSAVRRLSGRQAICFARPSTHHSHCAPRQRMRKSAQEVMHEWHKSLLHEVVAARSSGNGSRS